MLIAVAKHLKAMTQEINEWCLVKMTLVVIKL